MIERATSNFLKTMKGKITPLLLLLPWLFWYSWVSIVVAVVQNKLVFRIGIDLIYSDLYLGCSFSRDIYPYQNR